MVEYQKGMTIIELLVVLAISLIIVSSAIRFLNQTQDEAQYEKASSNVKLVLDATHKFYEIHCGKSSPPQPTLSTLVSENVLKTSDLAINPFGTNFVPQIQWGSMSNGSRIIVSSTFNSSTLASRHWKGLGADRVVGSTVYWDEAPSLFSRSQGLENAVNLHLHNPGSCR